jgi:hypothetical protein
MYTDEPFITVPGFVQDKIPIALTWARGRTHCSEFHRCICTTSDKEEIQPQWKETSIIPTLY